MEDDIKAESVLISVSHNGYIVEQPSSMDRYRSHQTSWTFESMKDLQRRLPEILQAPHEVREGLAQRAKK